MTGLIGSSIAAALHRDGHSVVGTTRRKSHQHQFDLFTLDMRTARKADWVRLLKGVDAVVNCVGVLQDNAETGNAYIDHSYVERHVEVSPGQYAVISVSDTGEGMSPEIVAQAFEPFFTTKTVGKGTGLGLSQVYGFVKQSKGHVKIYSEPDHGTTVKIYLPRFTAQASEPELESDRPVPEGSAVEMILVVEDDDDVRANSVEALRELGYRVIEAHDGPSALSLLKRPLQVDLLFTDVVLPRGMTGAQIADEARRLKPDLKVLFTTGYARNAIVHHGRLDKGVQLITKPFDFATLAARVRDVLDGAV